MPKQLVLATVLIVVCILAVCQANCQVIPLRAYQYRSDLRREVGYVWGVSHSRAVFAAQIHQESAWRPEARSKYAGGLGQFTPGTEGDMNRWYPELRELGGALNPRWAIRALVRYDRRLWDYVGADWESEGDRWKATLHSYNAGPGSLRKERRAAADPRRYVLPCLRRPEACQETAGYVRRILDALRPIYEGF